MNNLSLGFVVLALCALAFILYPLLKHRIYAKTDFEKQHRARLDANVHLFNEHLKELDASLAEKRITADEHQALVREQQRALLADESSLVALQSSSQKLTAPIAIVIAALVLVFGGYWFYEQKGSADDLVIQAIHLQKIERDLADRTAGKTPSPKYAEQLADALDQRLTMKEGNAQHWFMLARSAMELSDFSRAADAYRQLLELEPNSASVMAELAQAIFLSNGNKMNDEISSLALRALVVEPDNTTALGLAGINAFERRHYSAAVDYWQRAIDVMGADSMGSQALMGGIERAKRELANGGEALVVSEDDAPAERSITVTVTLDPTIHVDANTVVFIYARAWQGSKMPLAIHKLAVKDLPTTVTLTEKMAMSPAASLLTVEQVELVARVSFDGGAIARRGDWFGSIGPVLAKGDNTTHSILISEKIAD